MFKKIFLFSRKQLIVLFVTDTKNNEQKKEHKKYGKFKVNKIKKLKLNVSTVIPCHMTYTFFTKTSLMFLLIIRLDFILIDEMYEGFITRETCPETIQYAIDSQEMFIHIWRSIYPLLRNIQDKWTKEFIIVM